MTIDQFPKCPDCNQVPTDCECIRCSECGKLINEDEQYCDECYNKKEEDDAN